MFSWYFVKRHENPWFVLIAEFLDVAATRLENETAIKSCPLVTRQSLAVAVGLNPNNEESIMSTFQISHTAFVLPCSLHVKRLLGLCQPSVCRGMSRRSRRSSCPPASTHPWPPRPPFRMAGWTLTCGVKGEFKVEMDGHSVMTAAESMWFHITIIHYHGRKTYDIVFSRTQHLNRRHRHERHGKNILKLRKLKVILQSRFNRVFEAIGAFSLFDPHLDSPWQWLPRWAIASSLFSRQLGHYLKVDGNILRIVTWRDVEMLYSIIFRGVFFRKKTAQIGTWPKLKTVMSIISGNQAHYDVNTNPKKPLKGDISTTP